MHCASIGAYKGGAQARFIRAVFVFQFYETQSHKTAKTRDCISNNFFLRYQDQVRFASLERLLAATVHSPPSKRVKIDTNVGQARQPRHKRLCHVPSGVAIAILLYPVRFICADQGYAAQTPAATTSQDAPKACHALRDRPRPSPHSWHAHGLPGNHPAQRTSSFCAIETTFKIRNRSKG